MVVLIVAVAAVEPRAPAALQSGGEGQRVGGPALCGTQTLRLERKPKQGGGNALLGRHVQKISQITTVVTGTTARSEPSRPCRWLACHCGSGRRESVFRRRFWGGDRCLGHPRGRPCRRPAVRPLFTSSKWELVSTPLRPTSHVSPHSQLIAFSCPTGG